MALQCKSVLLNQSAFQRGELGLMEKIDKLKLERSVAQVTKTTLIMKAVGITASGLIVIIAITYIFSIFLDFSGNFTVRLASSPGSLSLSTTNDFTTNTERLFARPLAGANNISVNDLPSDLDKYEGEHGTKNYLAYTFYLKNTGDITCIYNAQINISEVTRNIDEAVRIRVYYNGEYQDYAKPRKDNSGPEPNTVPFHSQSIAYNKLRPNFKSGEIDKYTIVMWLDGNDPECVDDLIGGVIKVEMVIKIVKSDKLV